MKVCPNNFVRTGAGSLLESLIAHPVIVMRLDIIRKDERGRSTVARSCDFLRRRAQSQSKVSELKINRRKEEMVLSVERRVRLSITFLIFCEFTKCSQ